ncbi:hypothetical protein [Cohnella herbarum]|uniref:WYL domain-containing protein n=1 Tax=Cohnella herbarum TaxID=2728023 RepID=A0A7Z2ZQZ0_9BACL|nr:hypothetical protein [Cohnella herbarum]QJD87532.1 hypothetical protein HH215_33035 [Cohnella herbarum]
MAEKYIGRVVQIIYQDAKGRITQRTVLIQSVESGKIRAYDVLKKQPRMFIDDRVLAVQPVMRHAS